ncbi:MAG: hypothetical protein H6765_01175 [Candidatus Peribacteria bacterium]|nr:MAG: hypothetical protein H6765_01175 [Candidatus Peribacteria bacterium]
MGLSTIYQVIQDVAAGNISEDELHKALGNVTGKTQMGIETSNQLAHFVGAQYLFKGKLESLDQTLNHYQQVTLDQLQEVAKKLTKEHLYAYRIQ